MVVSKANILLLYFILKGLRFITVSAGSKQYRSVEAQKTASKQSIYEIEMKLGAAF